MPTIDEPFVIELNAQNVDPRKSISRKTKMIFRIRKIRVRHPKLLMKFRTGELIRIGLARSVNTIFIKCLL